MHTGYDNFWMHSRLKPPVLNLPKNDNQSCALLTDSYKLTQSRGCPSHLSNFTPSQNNAASSHEKDYYRNSQVQSTWPSSVYSPPFMPSYANNLHPQEPYFSHTNNFAYSFPNHQAQENHDFRHLEMSNSNVNILTMQNTNTSTLANNGIAHAQSKKNTNTQTPRIRVKDVYSLNNQSIQGQLQLDGYFGARQHKDPLLYAPYYNRALESQIQTKNIRYRSANLVELSKSSHFEHRTAKQTCSNTQEQFQNSCSFYQQNDGSSVGDFELRQIESNISSESFQSRTPASLLNQLLTQESIPSRGLRSCEEIAGGHGNAQPGHGGEKVTPMRNLAELQYPNYSDSSYSHSYGLNERAPENSTNLRNVHCDLQSSTTVFNNVRCDIQQNLTEINEANLKSRNSASNTMAKNAQSVTSKSPPFKEINQQNCFTKIGIPNTGKTSLFGPNGSEDTERKSGLNLQNFFQQNDKNCVVNRNTPNIISEENGVVNSIPPPVGENSFVSHRASPEAASIPDSSANEGDIITHKNSVPAVSTSLMSPRNCQEDTIDQRPRRQEFVVLSSKDGDFFQHSTGAPEIIQQKFAAEISGEDDSTAEQGSATNDFTATPLTLKQESFHSETEGTSLVSAQNPPGGKKFHPTIKTEKNYENSRVANSNAELGAQPPDLNNETLSQFHVEGCSSDGKYSSDSAPVADSEDHSDKVNTLKSSSSKRDVQKSEKKKRRREVSLSRVNYKSKINRDKLDLLIQFLKKDQGSDGTSSCKKGQYPWEAASNANSDSYRNRRKLNKASIVRNKNNSREMISLMSPKSSNLTCKTPRITEGSKNSEKTEDGKSNCSKDKVTVEESVDVPKERTNCNNPCQEDEPKKSDSWAEPSNGAAGLSKQHFQESPEKAIPKNKCTVQDENAIISTVRAFQNSKTHFCVSCKLASSIESFWINAVSGEVRCLNCFKRKALKAEAKENVLNSKSNDSPDSSVKPRGRRKSKTEKENKSKDSAAVGGSNSWNEGERKRSSKCEDALRKLNGMKENVRQELLEMFVWENHKSNEGKQITNSPCRTRRSSSGDGVESQKGKSSEEKVLKTEKPTRTVVSSEEVGRRVSESSTTEGVKDINATRKRKSFSGEEDFAKRERQPSSIKQGQASIPKEQYSEGGEKKETAIKTEKSHGRRGSRSEEVPENRLKTETKGVASSITRRSSDECHHSVHLQCGEEFTCHRVSVIEERGQKDVKIRLFSDESRKPLPREGWPTRKDYAAEETAKRSAGHETSDKSKNQNTCREGRLPRDQKRPSEAKTSKPFPGRDPKAPEATASSTSNQKGVENEKLVESTEQPRKRKYSEEDFNTRKVQILEDFVKKDPSKSSEASKENDNSQRGNLWSARISREKSERSDASKEECVLLGEYSRKEAKQPPEGDLGKGKRAKPSEPAKSKARGFVEQPRRKSKEGQRGPEKATSGKRTSEGPKRKSLEEESALPSRASAMKLFPCSSGPRD